MWTWIWTRVVLGEVTKEQLSNLHKTAQTWTYDGLANQ